MTSFAVIVPVAGLSARMGSFKPLIKLNGFPLIELTVQSALDGGVQMVSVITGRNADEVQGALLAALSNQNAGESAVIGLEELPCLRKSTLLFTHNSAYEASDMFTSIRLGLRSLLEQDDRAAEPVKYSVNSETDGDGAFCHILQAKHDKKPPSPEAHCLQNTLLNTPEAVFILPGDMPGVSPKTFAALQKAWLETRPAVLVPRYQGKRGHPLLISHECFAAVLAGATGDIEGTGGAENTEDTAKPKGTPDLQPGGAPAPKPEGTPAGGLRDALADFTWVELEVDDPGILLDADTPDALAHLEVHVRKTRGVSEAVVQELFALHETPSNVQDHTRAVAQVALRMAQALNRLGFGLDSGLCRSGGELHDLNRVESEHSQVASAHLRELGYEALACVVGAHDRELKLEPSPFTEANIVFVADKLVKNTTLVSIEKRYAGAVKRFPAATRIGKLIQKDCKNAFALLEHYVQLTGDEALLNGTKHLDKLKDEYHATNT